MAELTGVALLAALVLIVIYTVFGVVALCRGHAFSIGAFSTNFSYKGA